MAKALSVVAVLLAVVALAINFVVPGPAGPTGPAGTSGQTGADGLACWDLNENGQPDTATEDRNGDTVVNVNDCAGAQGPQGPGGSDGINCWDLNQNGVPDLATEDLNGDLAVDVLDCTGPAGPGAVIAWSTSTSVTTIGSACTTLPISVTITVPSAGVIVASSAMWFQMSHTSGTEDTWQVMLAETDTDCDPAPGIWRWQQEIPAGTATGNYWYSAGPQRVFTVGAAGTYTYYVNSISYVGQDANDQFWRGSTIATFYPT